jgi:hypothetical protein
MVTAAATFDFLNLVQATGCQFGQRFFYRQSVRVENPDASAAQAVKHSTPDSPGADDGIKVLRRCMARPGTGIDSDAFTAIAVDHQQCRRRAKIRGDFGIQTIELINGQTDFHLDKSSG